MNHRRFPTEITELATSLRLETGQAFAPDAVLPPLLDSVASYYEIFLEQGREPILNAFQQASSYASGRRVVVVNSDEPDASARRGITAGLDRNGMLMLRGYDGQTAPVLAGSVRPDNASI